MTINGMVRVRNIDLLQSIPKDMYVVMYILEHVKLKSYIDLFNRNDFTQLLLTGSSLYSDYSNSTNGFGVNQVGTITGGLYVNSVQPIAKQYYRLLKKKVIRLRYAGTLNTPGGQAVTMSTSIANAHDYMYKFSYDISKHLPATLKYPENGNLNVNPTITPPTVQTGLWDPTNSAPFMCFGCYNPDGNTETGQTQFELQYVTSLHYKDL